MGPQATWYMKHLVRLLGPLPERALSDMLTLAGERRYRAHERVFSAGAASDHVFILVSGRVKLFAGAENGKELILDILRPGDILGESALTGEARRRASAETLEESLAICYSRTDFEQLMRRLPALALAVNKVVVRRLVTRDQQIHSLISKTVAGRLASLLQDEARRQQLALADGAALELDLTHQEIAQWIGTSRETVTALLSRFAALGIIEVDRRRISVRDAHLLEECAHDRLHVSPRQPAPVLPSEQPLAERVLAAV